MPQVVVWGNGEATVGSFKPKKTVASAAIVPIFGGTQELWAVGTVTGDCQNWMPFEFKLGDIDISAPIPTQSIRNSPSTGCPPGYPLTSQGIQLKELAGYPSQTYELVTWQSMPSLQKRSKRGELWAVGVVTGDCQSWISFEHKLGDIDISAPIPTQSIRNSPSTGCPPGYPLTSQGIQLNELAGYPSQTYELVTWQSMPSLQVRDSSGQPIPPPETSGCAITITYSDNLTQQIPVTLCPEWVRVASDQDCPAGSCECVHDGYKCCIDPASGVVVKKIRISS